MPASLRAKIPAAIANWKERSIERTHLAGRPNSFSASNAPPRAANLMAWLGEVKRSKRWLPSLDLITNSTCLSICFCWISADTGSIKLRPDKISSNTPSRKMRSQLPGPPAAIPLMTMSLSQQFLASAKAGAAAAQVAVQEEAPNSFSTGVAVPVTQFTKAGLKVEWLPYISVPAQSK